MTTCMHPHIFRISTREVYRCLACGQAMAVVSHDDLTNGTAYIPGYKIVSSKPSKEK